VGEAGGASAPVRPRSGGPAGRPAARLRLALFLLCLASFMAVVDNTIVTIALPSMRRELGFSGADAGWVLNGYVLAFGGLLLLCGRAGDLWGRRTLFLAGLVLFGVSSLIGGLATAPWVLVFARVLQGVGAAAFVPASLSLLTSIFERGEERDRAVGIYGGMAALGFVVGMVGGGVITDLLGWRWVLFVNVPVALVALLATPAAVPESRGEDVPRVLDVPGAATVTLGLAALIYAVTKISEGGRVSVIVFGAAGMLLLVCFFLAERRSSAPLVPLGVLAAGPVVFPNAAIFLQSMIGLSWLYVLTLYFQEVLGYGPLAAGLLFIPMTVSSVPAALVAGRLVTRFGVMPVAVAGLALLGAGVLLMMPMSETGCLLFVLFGMVVGECGFMLSNVPLTIAATGGVNEDERGLASGLMNTSIQLGNAFGLAAVATVVAALASSGGYLVGGLRWGLLVCVAVVVVGLPVVLFGLRGRTPKEGSSV
jgi:EmrB/QacA subfamily drug resistance transporter